VAAPKKRPAEPARRQGLESRRNSSALSDAEDLADAKALELANDAFERLGRKSILLSEAKRRLTQK
jgi:hypothetical protein